MAPSYVCTSVFPYVTSKSIHIRDCIQKSPDWQPGARTANGTATYH